MDATHHPHHLTDDELVSALDRELPGGRQREAEAHLAVCVICRSRGEKISEASRVTQVLYRHDFGVHEEGDARARARLAAALGDAAARGDRPFATRLLGSVIASPGWVLAAAAVVIAVVSMRLLLPSPASPLAAGEHDALPRASLTPGAVSNISAEELCAGVRHTRPIPASVRRQVLRDYSMEDVPEDQYELDYLITPELGGATDARNLWPQRYAARTWNAHVKDELEELLPSLVCARQLDLAAAQRDMAVDWIAAYRKYFKTEAPRRDHATRGEADDDVVVMVDDLLRQREREWPPARGVTLIAHR